MLFVIRNASNSFVCEGSIEFGSVVSRRTKETGAFCQPVGAVAAGQTRAARGFAQEAVPRLVQHR